jgi:hypothetical protein
VKWQKKSQLIFSEVKKVKENLSPMTLNSTRGWFYWTVFTASNTNKNQNYQTAGIVRPENVALAVLKSTANHA